MAKYRLHDIGFSPGSETVRLTVEGCDGFARGRLFDLYSTQSALNARTVATDSQWGDAEAIAETVALLKAQGDELATDQ